MHGSFRILVSIVLGLTLVAGCMSSTPSQQLQGTLHSVRDPSTNQISGWTLMMGMGGNMGGGMGMPLDVSKVKTLAEQLDGKQVVITAKQDMSGSNMWKVEKIGVVSQ